MRMSFPAAVLAMLAVWPSSAGAQTLEPEVEEIVRCAAVTLAHSVIRAVKADDTALMKRGFVIANRAMFTKHKKIHGRFPESEEREAQWLVLGEELSSFSRHYDEGWSQLAFQEIVGCYEELTNALLGEGRRIMSEDDVRKLKRISESQAQGFLEKLEQ